MFRQKARGATPSRHILPLDVGFIAKIDETLDAFGNYDVNLPTGNSFHQSFSAGLKMAF